MANYKFKLASSKDNISSVEALENDNENALNTMQSNLANLQENLSNAKSQYDYSAGGNIYDSIPAANYYVAETRDIPQIAKDRRAINRDNAFENYLNSTLNTLELEQREAQQRLEEEQSEEQESTSTWVSVILSILGMCVMFI